MNNLTTLPTGVFSSLRQLSTLWIFSNQIAMLPPGIFDSLESLETL